MSKFKVVDNIKAKKYLFPLRDLEAHCKVTLIEVNEAFYRRIYPEIWRTWKAMHKTGRCLCPKRKRILCDAQCDLCYYEAASYEISLDAPVKAGENLTVSDTLIDISPTLEDILADAEELNLLSKALDSLTEEERRICKLILIFN